MGTRLGADGRPLPMPNPTTQPYFDAARERRLVVQRCPRDGLFFYPRSRCPGCLRDDWAWEELSGRGVVHAVTIDRIGHDPALLQDVPFNIAIVELEEGPRLPARIVDCPEDQLRVDLPVTVAFEDVEDVTLVRFRPRD
jgi:hypothetical protein